LAWRGQLASRKEKESNTMTEDDGAILVEFVEDLLPLWGSWAVVYLSCIVLPCIGDGGVTRGLKFMDTVDDKGSSATSTSSSDKNLRAPQAFNSFNIMSFCTYFGSSTYLD
jgi:hypothetical protein